MLVAGERNLSSWQPQQGMHISHSKMFFFLIYIHFEFNDDISKISVAACAHERKYEDRTRENAQWEKIMKIHVPQILSNSANDAFKVPKRENFLLAFFALSEPIWVGDLGTKQKKIFFRIWPLISIVYGFLPHIECAVNQKKNFS